MKKFRKNLRLKNYDYSQDGSYYITICTNFKEQILWQKQNGKSELSDIGRIVDDCIVYINTHYDGVSMDKYCIMPNHIHLIITLNSSESGRGSPPLRGLEISEIVGRMKSYTTKKYKELTDNSKAILWQRDYYEHVIRNDEDYAEKWQYIDENALKWNLHFNY